MSWGRTSFIIVFLMSASAAAESTCAKNFSELDSLPALSGIKSLLSDTQKIGFVNKTEGSYFFIEQKDNQFIITFFTTGFLDLYGIRKSGPITFCDDNGKMTAIGLDRTQNLFIDGARLEFGQRGARESFIRGPMPEKLARINEISERDLASY